MSAIPTIASAILIHADPRDQVEVAVSSFFEAQGIFNSDESIVHLLLMGVNGMPLAEYDMMSRYNAAHDSFNDLDW